MESMSNCSAQVFEGHPFIVEAGVSLGGKDVKQVSSSFFTDVFLFPSYQFYYNYCLPKIYVYICFTISFLLYVAINFLGFKHLSVCKSDSIVV